MKQVLKTVEFIFEQKAVRMTAMRQLLLEYFLQEKKIVGLQEIEKDFPRADRITLYRTLKTFEAKGIIHGIEHGNSETKYALCQGLCTIDRHFDRHPHFHCQICKETICLETIFIPQIKLPKGYESQEIRMMIKGVCKNCKN